MELDLPYFVNTKLQTFSRVREGGPGRPLTLLIHCIAIFILFLMGRTELNSAGISSWGPAMVFLSLYWAATLLFWIIIKAALRDTNVHISIDSSGIEMLPSARQKNTDRKIGILMLIVFLLTFKGGQWSAWQSSVKWKKVKKIKFFDHKKEILIKGGPWDIRIPCRTEDYKMLGEFIKGKVKISSN